jgi:hypothetical protein
MQVLVVAVRGILALAFSFILIDAAKAETEVAAMGGVINETVTVTAIDAPNRLLTVSEPNGNLLTIKLGPNVPPDRIRLNERVTISYSEGAAVNYNKRIITFAAANGQTRKILIDPSVPGLDQVQVGDQVVLLVTRSVAVNVKTI